jgi:hypothetical protein
MFGLVKTMLFTAALRQSAGNAKRSVERALLKAAAVFVGLVLALVGIGFLIGAGHQALAYETDSVTASLVCGGVLLLVGLIVIAVSRIKHRHKPDLPSMREATGLPPGLLGPDVERLLQRNVGPLAIGAFVAGLLLSARRR